MNFEVENTDDKDTLDSQLLTEGAERFNIDEVTETDELYRVMEEIEAFAEGGSQVPIQFEINGDTDFNQLEESIYTAFGEDLLNQASISRITILPDIVHLNIGKGMYLTLEEYRDWVSDSPKVADFKVRAENFTTFQTTGWLKDNFDIESAPLPILVYSFEDEDLATLDYLNMLPTEERLKLYKLDTVSHEIGHHLFTLILSDEKRVEFAELCKSEESLTEYSNEYRKSDVYEEEQFCEAIRLLTTNPEYLNQKSVLITEWLQNLFPQISLLKP